VRATSAKEAEDMLLKAHSELEGCPDAGLVLDGQTLLHTTDSAECQRIIYDLGIVSRSCICARLSPMQKLELVNLVRRQDRRAITLAIGDGANDVPMIQGAHVGVAIRGKEGTQAMQASDIAISLFKFIVPLLLCHGRRAYRRVALFLNFYLYKNVALLMCDVWWMHQDKFRARIAFPEYLSIGFNVVYSALHILFILGYDQDLPDQIAVSKPELYTVGPRRALFNIRVFAMWMLVGVLQGSIVWVIPYYMVEPDAVYDKSKPVDWWIKSVSAFTAINVLVNMKLVLYSQNPFSLKVTILPTCFGFASYGLAACCLSYTSLGHAFQPNMEGIPGKVFGSGTALMAIFISAALALSLDAGNKVLMYFLCPSALQLAQRGQ